MSPRGHQKPLKIHMLRRESKQWSFDCESRTPRNNPNREHNIWTKCEKNWLTDLTGIRLGLLRHIARLVCSQEDKGTSFHIIFAYFKALYYMYILYSTASLHTLIPVWVSQPCERLHALSSVIKVSLSSIYTYWLLQTYEIAFSQKDIVSDTRNQNSH